MSKWQMFEYLIQCQNQLGTSPILTAMILTLNKIIKHLAFANFPLLGEL